MFCLTSKFHVNRINTFGFMEGGGGLLKPPQAQELQKSPGRIGLKGSRWMGSHFQNWIEYNGVTFLVELLEWGRAFSGFLG